MKALKECERIGKKEFLEKSQGTVSRQKLRYWENQKDHLEGLTKEQLRSTAYNIQKKESA